MIDTGDKVVVMASVCGKEKGSGAEVRSPTFPQIWTIQNEQPIRMEALRNKAAALEALGLNGWRLASLSYPAALSDAPRGREHDPPPVGVLEGERLDLLPVGILRRDRPVT